MAALQICRRNLLNKLLGRSRTPIIRSISTSEKKKEEAQSCPPEELYKKIPDFSKPLENKNWLSYGYDEEDELKDRVRNSLTFFSCFTLLMVVGSFLYYYYPDTSRRNWAHREAFIRLYEREQLGLDAIDINYVDPEKVVLPPDEEIGEDEIII